GHDVAGRHERGQETESRVQGQHAAPVARSVEDVVDDQGDVVEHLEHARRADQGGWDGSAVDRAIAAPDGQWAEVLRASLELPLHGVADLLVRAPDKSGDLEVELTDLGFEPELGDDAARHGRSGPQGFASQRRQYVSPSGVPVVAAGP